MGVGRRILGLEYAGGERAEGERGAHQTRGKVLWPMLGGRITKKICIFGLEGMWYRTEDRGLRIRELVLAWLCHRQAWSWD